MNNWEDQTIDHIALTAVLDKLSPFHRELLWLRFAWRQPADYKGHWPPSLTDITEYLGERFRSKPLNVRTLHRETDRAMRIAQAVAAGDITSCRVSHLNYIEVQSTFANWIDAQAAKLSFDDPDLADDLKQEALIALWQTTTDSMIGITSANAKDRTAYTCGIIRNAMRRHLTRQRADRETLRRSIIMECSNL